MKIKKISNFSSSLPTVGVIISLFVCVHPEWLKSQPLTNLEMGPPQTPEPQVLWSRSFWSPELWEISSWGLGGAWTAADVTDAQWTKIVFIIRLMDWLVFTALLRSLKSYRTVVLMIDGFLSHFSQFPCSQTSFLSTPSIYQLGFLTFELNFLKQFLWKQDANVHGTLLWTLTSHCHATMPQFSIFWNNF